MYVPRRLIPSYFAKETASRAAVGERSPGGRTSRQAEAAKVSDICCGDWVKVDPRRRIWQSSSGSLVLPLDVIDEDEALSSESEQRYSKPPRNSSLLFISSANDDDSDDGWNEGGDSALPSCDIDDLGRPLCDCVIRLRREMSRSIADSSSSLSPPPRKPRNVGLREMLRKDDGVGVDGVGADRRAWEDGTDARTRTVATADIARTNGGDVEVRVGVMVYFIYVCCFG